MSEKLKWQLLKDEPKTEFGVVHDIETWRARVHGGWLVSVWAKATKADGSGRRVPGGTNWGGGVTFVPDPEGSWKPPIDKTQPTIHHGPVAT